MKPILDFRSDTVTQPTDDMRRAMAEAEVGDDVLGADPTIQRLEERIADLTGKEAALYVPSGSMSNLIALRLHCRPGEELLCEANCHVIFYEQAGYAQINGIAPRLVEGEYGVVEPEAFEAMVRPENMHMPRTRMILLENTHNRGGGRIQPYHYVERTCRWALDHGFTSHLDGARLFNAVVATGIDADQWSQHFDTVSICFSKGLGAPVGSALCGTREWIDEARRHRKVLGGGMRQAGIIAAGALFALEHHIDRLAEDHANAQRLADGVAEIDGLTLSPEQIDTNMVFFELDESLGRADEFCTDLHEEGLLMLPVGPRRVRAVTHLDVTAKDVDLAIKTLQEAVG